MIHGKLYWLGAAAGIAILLSSARPADARFDIGIGSVLGNSGIHTGLDYRFGGWNDRFGSHIFLDASRYLNKRKKKDGDRRQDERRSEPRRDNVRLDISPARTWVFLNGTRIEADGRSKLTLPEGRYRLEFVRPGYRTEITELAVQSGIRYDVKRKLASLQDGESADSRIDDPGRAVSVEEALHLSSLPPTAAPAAAAGTAPAPDGEEPRERRR